MNFATWLREIHDLCDDVALFPSNRFGSGPKLLLLKNHWLVQYQCSSNRIPALMVGLDLSDLSDCLSPFMDHHPISIPYSSQLDFPPLLKGTFSPQVRAQHQRAQDAGRFCWKCLKANLEKPSIMGVSANMVCLANA